MITSKFAGIQYAGIAGVSKDCWMAVLRLIQFGDIINRVQILTASSRHCLFLTINSGELVAIKSGFSSGYSGEGPRSFSEVLCMLEAYCEDVDEFLVTEGLLERIDYSCLTNADLELIERAAPVRPTNWHEYILQSHRELGAKGGLYRSMPAVLPFAIVDVRITDLARDFWSEPDHKLMTGYRRLEDIVRRRSKLTDHSQKLFARAFDANSGPLAWKDIDSGEHVGRVQLFTGAFMAHRNPRAHQERRKNARELLGEFLLVNHLFGLEREAIENAPKPSTDVPTKLRTPDAT